MKTPAWVMITHHSGTDPLAHIVKVRRHDGGLETMCGDYGRQLVAVEVRKGDDHCGRCLKVFDWTYNDGPEVDE